MKKTLSLVLAMILTLLLAAGNVLPVFAAVSSVTLPADVLELESQSDVDRMVSSEGFLSGTFNGDGNVTFLMTEEKRVEMSKMLKAELEQSFREIVQDPFYGITDIGHDENYTVFDVVTSANSESEISVFSKAAVPALYAGGVMYSAFDCRPGAPVTINYLSPSGATNKTWYLDGVSQEDLMNSLLSEIEDSWNTETDQEKAEDEAVTAQLSTTQYVRQCGPDYWSVYLVIQNNSDKTATVHTTVRARDAAGNILSEANDVGFAIAPGRDIAIEHMFFDCMPAYFDHEVKGEVERYYESALPDLLFCTVEDLGNGVEIYMMNEGPVAADFPSVDVLFFAGDKLVGSCCEYFVDDDYQLKPGATISKVLRHYENDEAPYDNFKVFMNGTKVKE